MAANRVKVAASSPFLVRHSKPGWLVLGISFVMASILRVGMTPTAQASDPVDAGYRDFSYGSSGNSTPSGEKPESKLWWNDGFWWGCLYNDQSQSYHIYRLDMATQSWVDTETILDDRNASKADTLWDDQNRKLYVASHVFTNTGQPTSSSSQWGRLYRYTYSAGSQTYSLDAGFPVNVTRGKSETLVLAKDSWGRLWVTYVESQKVMVNRSVSSDLDWGVPFVLPVKSVPVSVAKDDISSIIAFQGSKIGVMWSNQLTSTMYFAAHLDGDADTVWQAEETALPDSNCSGACADDHINLKAAQTDGGGRVFAAVKTDQSADQAPLFMLLVRDLQANWRSYVIGRVTDNLTRPIVLLDEQHGHIHVFATAPTSGGVIYKKTSDLNNIQFPVGRGDPFIKSPTDTTINNATSTKQNVNGTTGLLVLASDQKGDFYLHNFIDLAGGEPTITSFTPTSGPAGTAVTITGSNVTGATEVAFNGTPATSFTVVSDTQIDTTVPTVATTGKISVTNTVGTGFSTGDFVVGEAPTVSSFTPTSGPVGTTVTITGNGFTGATAVAFNGTAVTAFTVVSDTQINTTVPTGATTGKVSVTNAVGPGFSLTDFTVTLPPGGQVPPTISSFTPTSGPIGTAVTITGSDFTGATAVAFNGTPATAFTVVSDTQMTTTVPAGATTGKISVTNTAGTGVGATDFTVTPFLRIKDITFEGGSLSDPRSGADQVVGTVNLETVGALKGSYSARIPNVGKSYLNELFTSTDDLYVSFYIRVNALPATDARIAFILNAGTQVGNLYLRTNGRFRLRNGSTLVGSDTAPVILGQLYRIGIYQKKGAGNDAVLEGFLARDDDPFGAPFGATTTGTWTTAADRFGIGATISAAVDIVIDDIRLDAASMPPPSTDIVATGVARSTGSGSRLTTSAASIPAIGRITPTAMRVKTRMEVTPSRRKLTASGSVPFEKGVSPAYALSSAASGAQGRCPLLSTRG